jgi:hypothetical protein
MPTEKLLIFDELGNAKRVKARLTRFLENEPVTNTEKSAMRDTLGITGTNGDLLAANNLSDVASKDTAKLNLEIPDIGSEPNQSPLNLHLGSMAYKDFDAHYEEGTWTPTVSFGGGSTGVTFSTQEGYYTRIGNQATVHGRMTLTDKGSSNGTFRIEGLPFTSKNTAGSLFSAAIGYSNNWDSSITETPSLVVEVNTTKLFATVARSGSILSDTAIANNTDIRFSATYQLA